MGLQDTWFAGKSLLKMPVALTKPTKAPHGSIDWGMVTTLYKQGLDAHDIERETGIKRQTINVGLCKRGITKQPRDLKPDISRESLNASTRNKLAKLADRMSEKLLTKVPNSLEGLNLQADTAQKVAKTASLIHGWGESVAIAIIQPGMFQGRSPSFDQPEVIDVDTSESGTD